MWGYRLADYPNDKSLRATYRAFSHLSILHDASYMGCVQLEGTTEAISSMLAPILDVILPSVASQRYVKGHRLGHSVLFHHMCYPQRAIGPVKFLWQQKHDSTGSRKLWLWIHPASFDEAWQCLTESQKMTNLAKSVEITDLRDEILMFELTGPRSTALLHAVLDTISTNDGEQSDSTSEASSSKANEVWNVLKHLRTSSSLPAGAVLGITVQDPRLRFPQKLPRRSNIIPEQEQKEMQKYLAFWPDDVAKSDIWNETIRKSLRDHKIPEKDLNVRRSKNLLPGTKLDFTRDDAKIPILLVQRGSASQTNKTLSSPEFETGWNIILPKGWGVSFWKSLVFAGCRTAGLREQRSMSFESGKACYPYDFAGTKAYDVWKSEQRSVLEEAWKRKPPAKRFNFEKVGIRDPFNADFNSLVLSSENDDVDMLSSSHSSSASPSLWVLSAHSILNALSKLDKFDSENCFSNIATMIDDCHRKRQLDASKRLPIDFGKALVRVRIILLNRGTPSVNGRIYLIPNSEEYAKHVSTIKDSRKDEDADNVNMEIPQGDSTDMSCLIGYTTSGQYSYTLGKGLAIGSITLRGLLKLHEIDKSQDRKLKLLVLVKGVQSRLCRAGQAEVLY
ncbi:Ribonucleases P/MRP protein subunit pop1 [Umbelopsis sp. WA50703]